MTFVMCILHLSLIHIYHLVIVIVRYGVQKALFPVGNGGLYAVSYTHLDVYKRQPHMSPLENRYSFHSISHVARSVSAVKASGLRFQPFHYILTAIPLSDRYSLSSRISSSL